MTLAKPARSRPIHALVMLLLLWSGGRAAYELMPLLGANAQVLPPVSRAIAAENRQVPPTPELVPEPVVTSKAELRTFIRSQRTRATPRPPSKPASIAYRQLQQSSRTLAVEPPIARSIPQYAETMVGLHSPLGEQRRLSLSSWLLIRDGANGIAPAGTLGGSQIGARAYLPIIENIAATARVSAPLRFKGAEASIGIALRRGPATLLLERRVALEEGGRDDFSATLAAGVDGVRLPKQFRLDAYGQAGIVGRDGFADGAVRVERTIAAHGKSEVAVGGGVWGGTQPGIARVDAGPQIVARMPIAGGHLRASGEWRQRIAGNAQPTSGPALTLGMDF